MTWEAWFTLGTILLTVIGLASDRINTDTVMVGAVTLLMAFGIMPPEQVLAGFAHPAVLLIAAVFVIAAGLDETGAMEMIARPLLGTPRTMFGAQMRLMGPVAVMSAFMNNTPQVAMYIPIIADWAKKLRLSVSHLMMPLAFSTILGGSLALIGTASNIAINEMYLAYFDKNAESLRATFGLERPSTVKQFWWIGSVGLPVMVLGVLVIAVLAPRVLPNRRPPRVDGEKGRQYTLEMLVEPGSTVVGKSIQDAGLRQLEGLFLIEIERDGERLPAVSPEVVLRAGDRLFFAGILGSVVDVMKIRGLVPATDQVGKVQVRRRNRAVVEAVVAGESPLVNKTVREARFRTIYNAAIIAVHRNGEQVRGKIGDITLRAGDTLLLSTHPEFVEAHRNSSHFYLVSKVEGAREVRHERAWLALGILALFVAMLTLPVGPVFAWLGGLVGIGLPAEIPPVTAAFICGMLMVVTRCCTGTVAREGIEWSLLIVIACAIGLGRAATSTGAAQAVADVVFGSLGPMGDHATLLALFVLTNIFCQFVTEKAGPILVFPVAMALAEARGMSPEPVVMTIMIASAISLMTPLGNSSNLMVYGPGGYKFTDFLRLGIPVTILAAIVNTVLAPMWFPFHPAP